MNKLYQVKLEPGQLGFPPLDLQAAVALARLHCRLHLLPSNTLAHCMFTIHRPYPGGPALSSLKLAMPRILLIPIQSPPPNVHPRGPMR